MRRISALGCLFALALLLGIASPATAAVKLQVTASCVGSTLSGTATITGLPAGSRVVMQAQAQTSGWLDVGAPVTITTVARQSSYPVSFNIAGIRHSKAWRITVNAGNGNTATSNHIDTTEGGPPAQVPEVPAPLMIPASMIVTIGLLETVRRRRAGARRR
jgi:hypothetical protein